MLALFWIVVFFVAFVALAYKRARLVTAAGVIGVLLAVCTVTSIGAVTALVLWAIVAAVFGVLLVPSLRRRLITRPVLNIFRRVLPTLSATERTALDAGTVWWEGELFSGQPNWRRLEEIPPATLTAEEQAFIDGPVQELLDLCDEWQITQVDGDLTQAAWDYIKDNKFWGMIIPRAYGGLEFSAYAHSCVLAKILSLIHI